MTETVAEIRRIADWLASFRPPIMSEEWEDHLCDEALGAARRLQKCADELDAALAVRDPAMNGDEIARQAERMAEACGDPPVEAVLRDCAIALRQQYVHWLETVGELRELEERLRELDAARPGWQALLDAVHAHGAEFWDDRCDCREHTDARGAVVAAAREYVRALGPVPPRAVPPPQMQEKKETKG